MKEFLKSLLSDDGYIFYKNIQARFKSNTGKKTDIQKTFSAIYRRNYWGSAETVSGPGSELKNTEKLIGDLNRVLEKYNISSILDIPCGDFNWMQHVNLKNIKYTGADIVPELINENIRKYPQKNISFKVLDITTDQLPKADLIICRDCLGHLSIENISKALMQIKSSGSKYFLITSFNNFPGNYDIVNGEWRPVNLLKKPFNLPKPLLEIEELSVVETQVHNLKTLALWENS
jgi:hypothetical protein